MPALAPLLLFFYLAVDQVSAAVDQPASPDAVAYFEAQVRPILQAQCVACHGGQKTRGGLDMTTRDSLLQGGERGPVISLNKSEESLLIQAINYHDLKMPPTKQLHKAQIDVLTRWVKMGVPWSKGKLISSHVGSPPVDEQARNFWSFRPVVRPKLPAVKQQAWISSPPDAFILARLEGAGLQPAEPAARTTLLRRLYYDLIGLPPQPQEVAAFIADAAPDAYERVVDRLLADPRHGEKWGRHWLDLVRYAETNGYEFDAVKPNAWRYRDYVIASLNDDKPYDRFVTEQLAGDELQPATSERIIATGYYRLGAWDGGAPDRLQATYDELDDILATTGQVFLGLTVNCARCHDHKSDPFPQKDYYRLLAFFHNIQRYSGRNSVRPIASEVDRDLQREEIAANRRRQREIDEEVAALENALLPHLQAGERDDFKEPENRADILRKHVPAHITDENFERYEYLKQERVALERRRPSGLAQALCVNENGTRPRDTFVFVRGDAHSPGDKVEPGFPSVITTHEPSFTSPGAGATSSGRRGVLADWMVARDNPLAARVMVNRLWQFHFGRGLVRTPSDFGFHGAPPTHPELLDWLADEFVRSGWSLKSMHRMIVLSSTYRMSSQSNAKALARDPANDLYWRFDLRRLTAEELRDSMLLVSGNLNQKMAGPSVYPRISTEVLAGQSRPGQGWGRSSPAEQARRSVYAHVKRSLIVPILAAFDGADPDGTCAVRFATTQPTQALTLLNGEFGNEQARLFAARLSRQVASDSTSLVREGLWRVLQREPTSVEIERGVAFLARLRTRDRVEPGEALRLFCLLALNLNEFIYLE
jgi:mono/diheme cytochrome c family protein